MGRISIRIKMLNIYIKMLNNHQDKGLSGFSETFSYSQKQNSHINAKRKSIESYDCFSSFSIFILTYIIRVPIFTAISQHYSNTCHLFNKFKTVIIGKISVV